ncbi:MAG: hypothetical protein J5555_01865 [Firmicutes bacterium]|nr:hypothetical protein [Bacillota bacterium]
MKKEKRSFPRRAILLAVCFLLICLSACGSRSAAESADCTGSGAAKEETAGQLEEIGSTESEQTEKVTMQMKINDTTVTVQWEENESVSALMDLVRENPLTVDMSMYGGFEQVGPLGTSLPRNDKQTTTSAGDIVLYSGNQIVVFYGSNSWAYTRLGHVELSWAEMTDLLSHGDVTITLSVE